MRTLHLIFSQQEESTSICNKACSFKSLGKGSGNSAFLPFHKALESSMESFWNYFANYSSFQIEDPR